MNDTSFFGRGARACCCVLGLCGALAVPRRALAQATNAPQPAGAKAAQSPPGVEVGDQAKSSTTEQQAADRKRATVLGDSVSRDDLAHTSDLTAAEGSQRIVGATVVDGQFVYARGMGERYTNAQLNGVPLPSMDTDRKTVPLDLFPALTLDSLTINRQFLPDVPADFAAGSVRIDTREFPSQPLFQLSLTGAYNTASTGRKRPGYDGSNTDWLGFDNGRRSFPSGIPNQKLDAASTTTAQQIEYGHRFNTPLFTFMRATPPNFGLKLVAGNSYEIAPDAKLGVMMALSYGRSYQLEQLTQRIFTPAALPDGTQTLLVEQEYTGQRGVDSVRWGALGSAALELSRRHTVSLLGFHGQSADDTTSDLESRGASGFHATHLEYVSHALNVLQLRGVHQFPRLSGLEIDWQTSLGSISRDQPDTRDVRYQRGERDGVAGWNFVPDSSGQHQYLNQSDTTVSAGFDVLQPLIRSVAHETKLKFGALVSSRDTDFRARRFQLVPARTPGFLFNQLSFCPGAAWSGGCPDYLFRPDLIRPDGLVLNEWSLNHDQYQTGQDVYAVYGMVDAKLLPKLRAVAGGRVEISFQEFAAFDPSDRADTEVRSQIYETDWLPAASLVYEVTPRSDIRFGVSQTLVRPRPNELSPAPSTSSAGEPTVQGNPELKITKITNLDLRLEYFPRLRELLAAGIFYKHLRDPIEEISTGTGLVSYANASSADLFGAELEGRKSLAQLAPALRDFSLLADLTLTQSAVKLGTLSAFATPDKHRTLAQQAPYVVDLVLEYANQAEGLDVRVVYNVFGPRDAVVGSNGLPDNYELPRQSLDLSAAKRFAEHLEIKLQAQNILSAPVVFAYRDQQAYRQNDTLLYKSLGREPNTQRYNPGTILAATATYSY